VRIGLISIGETTEAPDPGRVAGRSIPRHQLDFALAQGCGKIVVVGNGASEEAVGLRHAAEAGAAHFQIARGVRDLPAAVRGDDELLVFAHGLLPDSGIAFDELKQGFGVLVLPAEAGWSAGFERLDLGLAWAGAMVVPGRLVAGLDQLPDDAEPISGLLRIARQAGVPERALPDSELSEGRWQIVRTAEAARTGEPAWLRRRLPAVSPFRPTEWLARWLVRRFGMPAIGNPRVVGALVAGALVTLGGAIAAAWFGLAILAFSLAVPAALAIESGEALRLAGKSTFGSKTKASRLFFSLHAIWDVTLLSTGVLAIDGSRAHRLFAPLISVGLLHIPPPAPESGWRALAADRGLAAVILALGAISGLVEGGFMALSLLLIVLRIATRPIQRG
jgi:hypothetical protein